MITKEDIARLAALARIKISEEEQERLRGDIDSILAYVGEVADVSGTAPEKEIGEHHNVFRDDGEPHESGIHTEALLKEAPQTEGDYIKVKKIL